MPQQRRSIRRRSSLVSRVAIGTALAASVAALVAATISLFVADRLVQNAQDRRLQSAAEVVLRELPSAGSAALKSAIAEEEAELAPESIRLSVHDGLSGPLLGGEAMTPVLIEPDTCASTSRDRACARYSEATHLYVVVSTARPPHDVILLAVSTVVAVIAAALSAAFVARRTARWALDPLIRLSDSLEHVNALIPDTKGGGGQPNLRMEPKIAERASAAVDETTSSCSEVEALRNALGALLARLGASLDAARQFSADAAHELRTPLTVIRGELDLLAESSSDLDEATRASLERLRSRVLALTKLVERLLVLSTTSERASQHHVVVSLEEAVRDVVGKLPDPLRARVRIHAESPGIVRGDESLLAALLENAIDNALKFSGEASMVEVLVREVSSAARSRVELEILDDGPGIAEAEGERVFEPFYRTSDSRARNTPGHGIGLALIAQIAAAHDGEARFVGRQDASRGAHASRGACLRISLPGWVASPSEEGGRAG